MECAIQVVWHSLKNSFTEIRNTTQFRKYSHYLTSQAFPVLPACPALSLDFFFNHIFGFRW
jgi:hypothetical protein